MRCDDPLRDPVCQIGKVREVLADVTSLPPCIAQYKGDVNDGLEFLGTQQLHVFPVTVVPYKETENQCPKMVMNP